MIQEERAGRRCNAATALTNNRERTAIMANKNGKRFRRPSHWTARQILDHYSAPAPHSSCILWTASKRGYYGHGHFWLNGRLNAAHRVAWELAHGPIPAGLCICHRCDVPACVNPDHLFLGTQADNVIDMIAKGRRADSPKGEQSGKSKLTEEEVRAIRASCKSQRAIAREFRISRGAVQQIKNGATWSHVL